MLGTIEGTLKHALFLARYLNKSGLQYAVIAVLLELGIPTQDMGFDCLKNAIILTYDKPIQVLAKGLYPTVGQHYTPEVGEYQVEQAIRSAITKAWADRDESVWSYYFPPEANGKAKKPTNAEFITRIARFLELWEGCCKEVDYEKE